MFVASSKAAAHWRDRAARTVCFLILRSRARAASRRMRDGVGLMVRDGGPRLLTMRIEALAHFLRPQDNRNSSVGLWRTFAPEQDTMADITTTMHTTGTSDGRVDWVDYAKGICIIMVVMMHSTLGMELAAGRE